MRTNLVGRSCVSAITHTPASGPFGPVTTPAMSAGPTETPWAVRGHAGRFAARPTIITWTNQRRIVLMSPPLHTQPLALLRSPSPEGRGGPGGEDRNETWSGGVDLHAREVPLLHQRYERIERRVPHALVEDLDLDGARVARALDGCSNPPQLDHAVPHHAAIHQDVVHGDE